MYVDETSLYLRAYNMRAMIRMVQTESGRFNHIVDVISECLEHVVCHATLNSTDVAPIHGQSHVHRRGGKTPDDGVRGRTFDAHLRVELR